MYWKCCANAPVIEVQEKKTEEKELLKGKYFKLNNILVTKALSEGTNAPTALILNPTRKKVNTIIEFDNKRFRINILKQTIMINSLNVKRK